MGYSYINCKYRCLLNTGKFYAIHTSFLPLKPRWEQVLAQKKPMTKCKEQENTPGYFCIRTGYVLFHNGLPRATKTSLYQSLFSFLLGSDTDGSKFKISQKYKSIVGPGYYCLSIVSERATPGYYCIRTGYLLFQNGLPRATMM